MAIAFSMRIVVVTALSITLIILGLILLMNISSIANINLPDPNPVDNVFSVIVEPNSSVVGTKFLIKANSFLEIEQQDLQLFIQSPSGTEQIILYDDGQHFDVDIKDTIYAGFFDSSNKELGEYIVKNSENEILATFQIHISGCEPIFNSYDEDKVNFVLVPSNYENYEKFKGNAMDIIGGENGLLSLDPFKSNRDKFSFTLVNASQNLNCEVGCNGVPTAICCNRKLVFEEASQCSYDSIVVLQDTNEFCGLASDYAAVCADNPVSNLAFIHELGHTFGSLADEYVYEEVFTNFSIAEERVINSPNCAPALCDKWNNITDQCISGCTTNTLFRSSEESIMGSPLIPLFNLVSQVQLLNVITNHVNIGSRITQGVGSYNVNLNYNVGEVKIKEVYYSPISSNIVSRISNYSVQILDKDKLLFQKDIFIPIIENFINASEINFINEKVDFSLALPFNPVGNRLIILHNDEKIEEVSLEVFQDICGNNICEESENHVSCSKDCDVNDDGFCEENICDSDCESQKYCEIEEKATNALPFVLVIIVLFVVAIFFVKRK